MIKEQYLYSALTGKITGCAMEVHRILGNGFQEVIYQRALAIEMSQQGLNFSREFEMPIFYNRHWNTPGGFFRRRENDGRTQSGNPVGGCLSGAGDQLPGSLWTEGGFID
jgi:hypothetical protein